MTGGVKKWKKRLKDLVILVWTEKKNCLKGKEVLVIRQCLSYVKSLIGVSGPETTLSYGYQTEN